MTTWPAAAVPTLYEWAGGRTAIERMIDCFYDRVERDDLISPLFPGGVSAEHQEHLGPDLPLLQQAAAPGLTAPAPESRYGHALA
jgi:truncated hemoglobin YjbI